MKHAFLLLTTLGLALISQTSLAQTTHDGEITQVQGFGEAQW
jgi:hypothetical protein